MTISAMACQRSWLRMWNRTILAIPHLRWRLVTKTDFFSWLSGFGTELRPALAAHGKWRHFPRKTERTAGFSYRKATPKQELAPLPDGGSGGR
ncbi:hypothetical protein [Rhizobium bangladeshense]|uniref:hypothetical protein n=1 Tax=Rhizobium bangladeshense TaxID=1138189 RepID=UPI001A989D25|nr:hypothetical protein [Rhizobium bangladeshense]MBX4869337.1 hypothetical protein [Rhizobium bangladeshense]MBX4899666.1 hypothetical protein [Rhizobium bangladeshense]MBX4902498.1 hypothetical protein [Rhizobium bangladeshense]MBY3617092.1 hypothetical protein [Rhizobium bangladeshense]QSY95399.1 hypothetical protein J2J97_05595 [Rhizobium bangladeshense]